MVKHELRVFLENKVSEAIKLVSIAKPPKRKTRENALPIEIASSFFPKKIKKKAPLSPPSSILLPLRSTLFLNLRRRRNNRGVPSQAIGVQVYCRCSPRSALSSKLPLLLLPLLLLLPHPTMMIWLSGRKNNTISSSLTTEHEQVPYLTRLLRVPNGRDPP